MYDDAYTRNDDNKLAVRTVSSSGDNNPNKDDVFTRDDEGRLAMRTVGGSGGGGSVDKNTIVNKADVLPTPNTTNLGQVYMYNGQTDTTYTHGYIYQVVAEQSATAVEFSGNIISTWPVEDFVRYLQEGGAGYNEVVRGTLTYDESGGLWDLVGYDANGNEVLKFHEYTEDLIDFGCVFVSETHQDGENCTFTLTTTASGYKWKRIDVQPAGGTGNISSVNGKTGAVVLDAKDVNAIPQYSTMPTAGASNIGEIVQYSGESVTNSYQKGYFYISQPTYTDPSATISQTVGSGLSNLSVDVDTFIEAEQPSGSETVAFISSVTESKSVTVICEDDPTYATYTGTPEAFYNNLVAVANRFAISVDRILNGNLNAVYMEDPEDPSIYWYDWELEEGGEPFERFMPCDPTELGITTQGDPQNGYIISYSYQSESSSGWSKNGTTVDIADYGISYSGVPADGDTLTVIYTAPVITSYAWNQINVQPAAGTAGIEWKTKVDLPAEYTGSVWSAKPHYTITGGLPDGTYEFYFSTKMTSDSEGPLGEVVFKVIMSIDNTNTTFSGKMGYVFDGNYMNDVNTVFGNEELQLNTLVLKNGSDIILCCPYVPWATDVFDYITPRLVPECFKLSAIKNVDTDTEYIATGAINLDGSFPTYTTAYGGIVKLVQLVNLPVIPSTEEAFTVPVSNFATGTIQLVKNAMNCSIHLDITGSELIINFTGKETESYNNITPYSQQIVRATGIFSGCYLAYGVNYIYVTGVDTTTAATLTGMVNCACSGLSNGGMTMWWSEQIPTESLTPLAQFGPQAYRLGTITSDGLGNIVQYTGETKRIIDATVTDCNIEPFPTIEFNVQALEAAIGTTLPNSGTISLYVVTSESYSYGVEIDVDGTLYEPSGWYSTKEEAISQNGIITSATFQFAEVAYTTEEFTNGYFYKANGTLVSVPASVAFTDFSPSDITVTVADADVLVTALSSVGGWSEQWVRDSLALNSTYFTVEYDFSTGTVTKVFWSNYGDIYQQDVLNCFTVSTTGSYSGVINIGFLCSYGYIPAHNDIQNPSWDRVDVQPAPINVNTTATLAVADWSNGSQTVTVNGVKADSVVFVSPAPASASDYASAGILCEAQAANSLTFTATTTPSVAITVNVVCM